MKQLYKCFIAVQCNKATLKEHHNCFNLICIFINSTKKNSWSLMLQSVTDCPCIVKYSHLEESPICSRKFQ